MPLVPSAQLVLINNPPDHYERLARECAFTGDLQRRAVRRKIRDLAHLLQIHVTAHQYRAAILARGLNGARPEELNGRAAVWTVGDSLAHSRKAVPPGGRSSPSPPALAEDN